MWVRRARHGRSDLGLDEAGGDAPSARVGDGHGAEGDEQLVEGEEAGLVGVARVQVRQHKVDLARPQRGRHAPHQVHHAAVVQAAAPLTVQPQELIVALVLCAREAAGLQRWRARCTAAPHGATQQRGRPCTLAHRLVGEGAGELRQGVAHFLGCRAVRRLVLHGDKVLQAPCSKPPHEHPPALWRAAAPTGTRAPAPWRRRGTPAR